MKLTSQASRVSLILSMIDTMKGTCPNPITQGDLERMASDEVATRPRYKPCTVEFKSFPTTIAAAHYLAHHRRDLWEDSAAAQRQDAHAVMENLRNRVKNWCNSDEVDGYFWN